MRQIATVVLVAFFKDALAFSLYISPLIATAGVAAALLVPRQPEPVELVRRQLAAGTALATELGSSRALAALGGTFFPGAHEGAPKAPDLVRGMRTWFTRRVGGEINGATTGPPDVGGGITRDGRSRVHKQIDAIPPMSAEEEQRLLAMANGKFRWCMRCFSDLYAVIWTPGSERPNIDELFDQCTKRLRMKPGFETATCTTQLNGTL